MKIKTETLTGAALDWVVASAMKLTVIQIKNGAPYTESYPKIGGAIFAPSTDWSQGGPIIERELLCLNPDTPRKQWVATTNDAGLMQFGPTALIAAMRCLVASKLGDTVDVPDELINN